MRDGLFNDVPGSQGELEDGGGKDVALERCGPAVLPTARAGLHFLLYQFPLLSFLFFAGGSLDD